LSPPSLPVPTVDRGYLIIVFKLKKIKENVSRLMKKKEKYLWPERQLKPSLGPLSWAVRPGLSSSVVMEVEGNAEVEILIVVVVVVDEGRQRFSKEESDDWVKYSTVT
jgi:hypothetical protein